MVRYVSVKGAWRSYANRRIRGKDEKQRDDVGGWKWQAREVVVCAGGLNDSGEAAFFAGVVLVQFSFSCARR